MHGEIIKVRDMHNTDYDPIIKVMFKKPDGQAIVALMIAALKLNTGDLLTC